MENQLEALKNLGLSDKEIAIYLALLKLGTTNATSLSKEVNLKRTSVYPILEKLVEQGLAKEHIQGKKKSFEATKPDQLKRLFERKILSLDAIVPYLNSLVGSNKKVHGVRFIKSKQELKGFYDEILEEYKESEYFAIGNVSNWFNIDKKYFLQYRKRRAEYKTKVKILLSSNSKEEPGQNDPSLLREYKYLPEKYNFKSTIEIFKDKIAIVGQDIDALCVVIEVPAMTDVFKSVFEILWEILPENHPK
jgi:sugar-specific transcriptional regulator TrmB